MSSALGKSRVIDTRYVGRWRLVYSAEIDRFVIVARHQTTGRAIYMLFGRAAEARPVFEDLTEQNLDVAAAEMRQQEMRGKA